MLLYEFVMFKTLVCFSLAFDGIIIWNAIKNF